MGPKNTDGQTNAQPATREKGDVGISLPELVCGAVQLSSSVLQTPLGNFRCVCAPTRMPRKGSRQPPSTPLYFLIGQK